MTLYPLSLARTAFARRQRGMTLIVSLVMLVMLTLFALSTMTLSGTNLKVVGNQQAQRAVESAANQAVEQVVSGSNIFKVPASQSLTIDGFTVAVTAPACVRTEPCTGCSKDITVTNLPEINLYEVRASTTDSVSGATAAVLQGVDLMMLQGYCP